MTFDGLLDLKDSRYDFHINVENADLNKLKLKILFLLREMLSQASGTKIRKCVYQQNILSKQQGNL
jgi:hypothetical protein